ncbi:MAG: 4-hydroxy-tetrahydrodipicolinate synthase [Candidatus Omnitrophica bacterium]|nr:4-hydroxy-tetrahydrodipicolinate synthase [Candidatus Omnitrophota bacterium]
MDFKGSYVALVTPFKDGKVDGESYRKLIEFHIDNGTDGILACGTTGEAATMSTEEHKAHLEITVETVNGRVPVLAGTGSNSTEEAVGLTSFAKKAGCDAALVVTPYYNKPTPEGQYRHFSRIASEVDIPIMLYNVPGRTGTCMLPETIARLSAVDNIVAVKEASGSVQQVMDILSRCDITVMSGDDAQTLPFMSVGASGVVSVVANIVPGKMRDLVELCASGDMEGARKLHYEILGLCGAMFIETNPLPVKTSMSMMGLIEKEWRLPLCEMLPQNEDKLRKVLEQYGMI